MVMFADGEKKPMAAILRCEEVVITFADVRTCARHSNLEPTCRLPRSPHAGQPISPLESKSRAILREAHFGIKRLFVL